MQAGGLLESERWAVAALHLAHAQALAAAAAVGVKPSRFPLLRDFLPVGEVDEPAEPTRDFDSWAQALLLSLAS